MSNLLGGNKPKDSTKTSPKEQVGNAVKDGLKGLFGKRKTNYSQHIYNHRNKYS